eukprot:4287038-Pyramimonas_sp.AAC.1
MNASSTERIGGRFRRAPYLLAGFPAKEPLSPKRLRLLRRRMLQLQRLAGFPAVFLGWRCP